MSRPCGRVWLAAGAVAVTALTGCSDAQIAAWLAWHHEDPAAAIEFANHPDVQAQLRDAARPETEPARSLWDDIAACESGGRWDHPPVTNHTGTYSGGLMIGHRWWPIYGGDEFAGVPHVAAKAEQIAVAERIADDIGLDRGWQCWP